MKISKLYANLFGKYGTVAAEFSWIGAAGIIACVLKRHLFDPIKEDTRAELFERGYSMEEISGAENAVKDRIADGLKYTFYRGAEKTSLPDGADETDAPCESQALGKES